MYRIVGGLAALLWCCAAPAQAPVPVSAANPDAAVRPQAIPTLAAPPLQACAVKAFDDYAANMSAWERQWADSTAGARPDLGEAAMVRARAHDSALQRDALRIRYLAAVQPESLDLDQTIASLRLFDWTPEQERALRQSETGYASAADAAEQAQRTADAQSRLDELENYFEASFTQNTGASVARRLSQILAQGNAALALCHKANFVPAKQDTPRTVTVSVIPAKS